MEKMEENSIDINPLENARIQLGKAARVVGLGEDAVEALFSPQRIIEVTIPCSPRRWHASFCIKDIVYNTTMLVGRLRVAFGSIKR